MKSLLTGGLLIVSLALTGNAAMAASTQIHAHPKAVHVAQPRVASRAISRNAASRRHTYALAPLPFGAGQFIQSILGGPLPPQYAQIVRNALREGPSRGSAGAYDSPSYPAVDTGSAANDALVASQQENQAIQEMNDTNAQTASMAAAEAQNDAANAATLQTEINAGM
jgi:hypothetical protein